MVDVDMKSKGMETTICSLRLRWEDNDLAHVDRPSTRGTVVGGLLDPSGVVGSPTPPIWAFQERLSDLIGPYLGYLWDSL